MGFYVLIGIFNPYQAFRSPKQDGHVHITSLDFDDQGDYLVAAGDDETIQIFDIKEGKSTKTVPSKKYGVHLARFTHHSRQVLHASTKVDGASNPQPPASKSRANSIKNLYDFLTSTMRVISATSRGTQTRLHAWLSRQAVMPSSHVLRMILLPCGTSIRGTRRAN